ncbi:SDR family oxidoreductase [Streptomyces sp. 150FB]|uniref:SDR family oxidoreductase n=1 Tax=Streptomyces sp. 150FB TaxID=1576605 RepID=UPI000A48A362|nr:SDR family oxidoreductase [Streptomyces sp. 150FB]
MAERLTEDGFAVTSGSKKGAVDAMVITVAERPGPRPDGYDERDAEAVLRSNSPLSRPPVASAEGMVEREQGVIVYVVPVAADDATADRPASVTGIESMTHAWAAELAPTGVRVNTVIAEVGSAGATRGRTTSEESPRGRRADLGHVVDTVSFLASPSASLISGTTLCCSS